MTQNIAVIGASGAIGQAIVCQLANNPDNRILACSRSAVSFIKENVQSIALDYHDEASIEQAATSRNHWHQVIVTTGILHDEDLQPERSIKHLSAINFEKNFLVNSIGPALIAKHFLPCLAKGKRSLFAVFSARVGSIGDNRLGGWYAYRASKAALNMLLKTLSIEVARSNRRAIIVGLHPGTVDSALSKPFQRNVPEGKLFTPVYSAEKLIGVMERLTPEDSGKVFAWDGQEIPP